MFHVNNFNDDQDLVFLRIFQKNTGFSQCFPSNDLVCKLLLPNLDGHPTHCLIL